MTIQGGNTDRHLGREEGRIEGKQACREVRRPAVNEQAVGADIVILLSARYSFVHALADDQRLKPGDHREIGCALRVFRHEDPGAEFLRVSQLARVAEAVPLRADLASGRGTVPGP
jgi:hypothetical protein